MGTHISHKHKKGSDIANADALSRLPKPEKMYSEDKVSLNYFFKRKNQLSIEQGCLMWANRVIIPTKLTKEVLKLLHDKHPGINRMIMLARGYVWWPKIDQHIKEVVKQCQIC